jgi:Skp family chaperone for outer membrane proteins
MTSLADLPDLVGFFSYSRSDDEHSRGALSQLRGRIQGELRLQLGRTFRLWQDTAAIPQGALWEDEIRRAVAESVFFIPIVTPNSIASEHCKFEFESFLKREAALGCSNLIFPLLYIRVPALESETQWRQHDVLKVVGVRQYMDWQKLRHRDLASSEVSEQIEHFCRNIFDALQQPWTSPQLHGAQAGRRGEDEERVAQKPTQAEEELARPAQDPRAVDVYRAAEAQASAGRGNADGADSIRAMPGSRRWRWAGTAIAIALLAAVWAGLYLAGVPTWMSRTPGVVDSDRAAEVAKRKTDEEAARKKVEDEVARRKAEDEAARKSAEEEADRKRAEEEAARKKTEEEAARKRAEEEADRKKTEEEAARKKTEEEAARKKVEEEGATRARLFDGMWRGTLSCAKLSFTRGPLKVPLDVTIQGTSASYSHKIYNQDYTAVIGTEEGSGTVGADGAINLSAVWKSAGPYPRYTFTASYSGTLSKGAGSLQGTQIWRFDGKTENRSCSITLTH